MGVTLLIRDADVAFIDNAHLSCIISNLAGTVIQQKNDSGSNKQGLVDLINDVELGENLEKEFTTYVNTTINSTCL